jgi:hypothetical protein
LVGTYDGISIVDISIPGTPVEKFLIPTSGGPSMAFDVKEYNGYAYVVNNIAGNGRRLLTCVICLLLQPIPRLHQTT